jgi:hypothetical protein
MPFKSELFTWSYSLSRSCSSELAKDQALPPNTTGIYLELAWFLPFIFASVVTSVKPFCKIKLPLS